MSESPTLHEIDPLKAKLILDKFIALPAVWQNELIAKLHAFLPLAQEITFPAPEDATKFLTNSVVLRLSALGIPPETTQTDRVTEHQQQFMNTDFDTVTQLLKELASARSYQEFEQYIKDLQTFTELLPDEERDKRAGHA